MSSKRGGARSGAGRPKLKVIKIPERAEFEWIPIGIPRPLWQEFKEAAYNTLVSIEGQEPQESHYKRLVDMLMIEAMDRYIRQNKRAAKKKAE